MNTIKKNVDTWRREHCTEIQEEKERIKKIKLNLFDTYSELAGDNDTLSAVASFYARFSRENCENIQKKAIKEDQANSLIPDFFDD